MSILITAASILSPTPYLSVFWSALSRDRSLFFINPFRFSPTLTSRPLSIIFEIVQVTVEPFLIFPISVAVTSSVNCLIPREIRSLSISMSNILAKILDIDIDKERISLGIKQLTEDVTATEIGNIRKGSTVTCTISNIIDNGLEVNVGENLKGFIKKSDLSRERADQKTDRYGVGDKIDAAVINIDKKSRKISLSIKAKEIEEEKKAMAEYGSSDSGASLGDILGAALAKKDSSSS